MGSTCGWIEFALPGLIAPLTALRERWLRCREPDCALRPQRLVDCSPRLDFSSAAADLRLTNETTIVHDKGPSPARMDVGYLLDDFEEKKESAFVAWSQRVMEIVFAPVGLQPTVERESPTLAPVD